MVLAALSRKAAESGAVRRRGPNARALAHGGAARGGRSPRRGTAAGGSSAGSPTRSVAAARSAAPTDPGGIPRPAPGRLGWFNGRSDGARCWIGAKVARPICRILLQWKGVKRGARQFQPSLRFERSGTLWTARSAQCRNSSIVSVCTRCFTLILSAEEIALVSADIAWELPAPVAGLERFCPIENP